MSVEEVKQNSEGLRGALPIELVEPSPQFSEEGKQLLKFHGIYQQTNRDVRGHNNKQYRFMVRSKLPGGRLTAEQYLIHNALADEFGQGDLRLTTRQAIQLHGLIKGDLKRTLQVLNAALVSTLGACGDVVRNVMCCPAPWVTRCGSNSRVMPSKLPPISARGRRPTTKSGWKMRTASRRSRPSSRTKEWSRSMVKPTCRANSKLPLPLPATTALTSSPTTSV
jgi:hypothetical protein